MSAKRILGIALIVAGIVFCFGLIYFQYLHCLDVWNNESAKHLAYDSAMDYFFEVSMGAIIVAVFGGGALATIGSLLCKKK